jgi:hypothetical protein
MPGFIAGLFYNERDYKNGTDTLATVERKDFPSWMNGSRTILTIISMITMGNMYNPSLRS